MMLINCPHCGPRNSSEFRYLGEQKSRPAPDADPAVWRDYLYGQANPAGWTTEGWWHGSGCGAFLTLERNTTTNEIRSVSGPSPRHPPETPSAPPPGCRGTAR